MAKVYVVCGYNGILNAAGPFGVCATRELAGKALENSEYAIEPGTGKIFEYEVVEKEEEIKKFATI